MTRSWKPRIEIGGKWSENGQRFHTRKAAEACAESVGARLAYNRGLRIGDCTAAPSDDAPNQDDFPRREDEDDDE